MSGQINPGHDQNVVMSRVIEVRVKVTSNAVTPLPSLRKARRFFNLLNIVSYSMYCIEGLLTCDQERII